MSYNMSYNIKNHTFAALRKSGLIWCLILIFTNLLLKIKYLKREKELFVRKP